MACLLRRLRALDYPHADSFDVSTDGAVRNIVVWLEDTKIRHYKIEERGPLRSADPAAWAEAFDKYLGDLQCPVAHGSVMADVSSRTRILQWLLGCAVLLEHEDNAETYAQAAEQKQQSDLPVDVASEEFAQGVREIAVLLGLPADHDAGLLLKAVAKMVREKFNAAAVNGPPQMPTEHLDLSKAPLGFQTNDKQLDFAAKILRLLYIADLRDLQTKINEAIVAVQALTANPKTNTSLGKVGK
eukprot:m.10701 g.10701  ORF g.10701 m.10701 type:complete len:243 (+) comp6046_c0_seq1:46-774(+)